MKTILISNRQSGKSHLASYEFLKSPDNSIFITHNSNSYRNFSFYPEYKNHFFSQNSKFRGKYDFLINRVIMDEYLLFDVKNRQYLRGALGSLGVREYFIYSTPNKMYDKDDFDFIKKYKESHLYFDKDDKLIKKYISDKLSGIINLYTTIKEYNERFDEVYDNLYCLYHSYLTDPNVNIINNDYFLNKNTYETQYLPDIERYGKFII